MLKRLFWLNFCNDICQKRVKQEYALMRIIFLNFQRMKKTTISSIFLSCFFLLVSFCIPVAVSAQYEAYKIDRDGDGVPDVREKCPDTDKQLNGQEFKVEVDGKTYFVKIVDIKKNFENRRRRLLVENSRLEKEKKALLDKVGGNKAKISKLPENEQQRIAQIDSIETENKHKLADLVYEGSVMIDGKAKPVEVKIGVDDFGCLPDRDGDTVPDLVDKCPDDPGKPYLFGCNDRDGDTVLDPDDECPDTPGLVRLKGCPDKSTGDRDKDGTPDKDDLCPDTPGPKSNKGCPEITTPEQKRIIDAASRVLFEFGKADLRPESLNILDQFAQVLFELTKKYGTIKVKLEGHTDNVGTNENNRILSQNRVNSVKEYLINKGVSFDAIAAEGFGEEKPIATNDTADGRQKNRRVEIAITNLKQ
jgi:OmpA-OmpF porin, OOP family